MHAALILLAGLSLVGGRLYVNTVVRSETDETAGEETPAPQSVVDVYAAPALAYAHSVRLPAVLRHAQVGPGVGAESFRVCGLSREGDALVGYAVTLR